MCNVFLYKQFINKFQKLYNLSDVCATSEVRVSFERNHIEKTMFHKKPNSIACRGAPSSRLSVADSSGAPSKLHARRESKDFPGNANAAETATAAPTATLQRASGSRMSASVISGAKSPIAMLQPLAGRRVFPLSVRDEVALASIDADNFGDRPPMRCWCRCYRCRRRLSDEI